jgi:hypothetical protein
MKNKSYRILTFDEMDYWTKKFNLNSYFVNLSDYNSINRNIDYRFTFSISKNNIERFENLLNQFLIQGFRQTIFEGNKHYYQNFEFDELNSFRKIEHKESHKTYGVDFIKFTYNFVRSPLLPTVLFIQTIKDVIEIIGNFWGYDENGEEMCSIKYPVGSIVSTKDIKSDFFVESITFVRQNTEDFKTLKDRYIFSEELLLYNLLEIEKNTNSQVLEFSDVYTTSSDFIIPNRGQRLDELLN